VKMITTYQSFSDGCAETREFEVPLTTEEALALVNKWNSLIVRPAWTTLYWVVL